MDESTYGFNKTDATELITLIGGRDVEINLDRPATSGGTIKYAYPPTGGIPAATYTTATKVLIPGTANCTLAEFSGSQYDDTGGTVLVENVVGAVVGSSGKPMVIARTSYGKWVVIVEDCTGTSGPVASSVLLPDPGDGGGSRGIDPGYSMGV